MKDNDKIEIQNLLAKKLEKYVTIIIKEYGDYINERDLFRLNQIRNYNDMIRIYDTGTITCLVTSNNIINFPESVYKLLKKVNLIPGSGIKKNHLAYNNENIILNDNTFEDYMKHVFLKGMDAKDFYEENLLHESLHFCGAGGSVPLLEGLTEHRTRELAKKYNLKTTGCGYPKEVKIVDELENIFGKDFMSFYLFDKGGTRSLEYLINNFGFEASNFLEKINQTMNNEFYTKYYNKTMDFKGLLAPLKKAKAYSDLKYDDVYKIIEDYKERISKLDNEKLINIDVRVKEGNSSETELSPNNNHNNTQKVLEVHSFQKTTNELESRGKRK